MWATRVAHGNPLPWQSMYGQPRMSTEGMNLGGQLLSITYPVITIVALSGYFLRLPLLLTVPLVLGPWLAWNVILLIHNAVVSRREGKIVGRIDSGPSTPIRKSAYDSSRSRR